MMFPLFVNYAVKLRHVGFLINEYSILFNLQTTVNK